jgi:hypothetical protein
VPTTYSQPPTIAIVERNRRYDGVLGQSTYRDTPRNTFDGPSQPHDVERQQGGVKAR